MEKSGNAERGGRKALRMTSSGRLRWKELITAIFVLQTPLKSQIPKREERIGQA